MISVEKLHHKSHYIPPVILRVFLPSSRQCRGICSSLLEPPARLPSIPAGLARIPLGGRYLQSRAGLQSRKVGLGTQPSVRGP